MATQPSLNSTISVPGKAEIPDISIVLVCWNNKDYLGPCLRSLYAGELKASFDVVVADNGSTDGSQDLLKREFPQVMLIQNDRNLGLGRASNQGIEATKGRYVLLLNNDTLVNGKSLDAMADFLDQNPKAGAVGGQLLNPDGSFQAAGSKFPSLLEEFLITTRLGTLISTTYPDIAPPKEVTVVDWLGSACLLLRREALDQVGLLNEDYFIYGDEADLQYRLKKAGWLAYYLPGVTTIHFGGRSMDRWRRRRMVYRGKLLFFQNNYGPFKTFMLKSLFITLSLLKLLVWSVALIFPNRRATAQKEIASNQEVIKTCLQLA